MPSTALKVGIDLDQEPPCVRLNFVDPGYQQGTGPVEIALPSDQVFAIRIIKPDSFGINFKDDKGASNWHGKVVPSEWPRFKALFTYKSGKSTVWISRSFKKEQLEKLGLPNVARSKDELRSKRVARDSESKIKSRTLADKATDVIAKGTNLVRDSKRKKQSDRRKKPSDQRRNQSD